MILAVLFIIISTLLYSLGNVYIAANYNQRVRKITVSSGIIDTVAGSSTSGGYSGDGGEATSAQLWNVNAVALDSSGTRTSLYSFLLLFLLHILVYARR